MARVDNVSFPRGRHAVDDATNPDSCDGAASAMADAPKNRTASYRDATSPGTGKHLPVASYSERMIRGGAGRLLRCCFVLQRACMWTRERVGVACHPCKSNLVCSYNVQQPSTC